MNFVEKEHYDNKELWESLNLSIPNKERIEILSDMIPSDVSSVADIGCGNGLFLNYLKKQEKIKKLVGVDISEKAMEELNTSKSVGSITDIPLKTSSYDLLAAHEVLEHLNIPDYRKAVKELSRVPSKYILISVPYNENLELEFVKCPSCSSRFNTAQHKRSFTEDNLKTLFKKEGFSCTSIEYISRRNVYFLLTRILEKYRKLKGVNSVSGTVCPVCGYKVEAKGKVKSIEEVEHTPLWKKYWPKRYKYKWIAVLYTREK